jgi:hypothetical protein
VGRRRKHLAERSANGLCSTLRSERLATQEVV